MKKGFMIAMALLVNYNVYSSNNLKTVRAYYYAVCLKESSVIEFEQYLNSYSNKNTVEVKGYFAVMWFLKADYYINPFKKWGCFKKGKEKLDELIARNRENVELRFLRLTIQDNLPSFLNYNVNIQADKLYLFQHIHQVSDEDLKLKISNYLCYHSMASIK